MKVTPKKNENLPSMLKRFRKLCDREGLMRDIKKREFYEKPSDRQRRARRRAEKRAREQNAEYNT